MKEESSKRKGTRSRKKKDQDSKYGIHTVSKDIVEIERNIIENWLISLKHWFQSNANIGKQIIIGVSSAFVLLILSIFVISMARDSHNKKFYELLDEFDKISKVTADTKNESLQKLAEKSDALCNKTFKTKFANGGCFLSALIYIELGDDEHTANSLESYSGSVSNDGLAAFTLFFSAYYNESGSDLDKSIQQYERVKRYLKPVEKEDIAMFHLARIYYYKKDYEKSKNLLVNIIDNFKSSVYLEAAKKYLLLVSMKQSAASAIPENAN
ncbi:MAG: hypothetical protein ABUK01_15265 [Leptospirales bacterium]